MLVTKVEPLGPSFDAGVERNTLIMEVNRKPVESASEYRKLAKATHPGDAGHTFSPRNPLVRAGEMSLELGRRIDYIMVRCGVHGPTLQVTDCRLAFDEPADGVWPTDHFGVVADSRD